MQIDDERESSYVEDRRGGGGGYGRAGGVGIGGLAVALIASYFLGIDPGTLLGLVETVQNGASQHATQSGARGIDPAADHERGRVSEMKKILAKTEDTWGELFARNNAQYQPPTLVLFRGSTPTACGSGQSAMGPFYCPGDQKVYLDLGFFDEMARRFHAGGDFARAYVIAHEIGHHVQKQIGVTRKTEELRARLSAAQYNRVSVRVELQADCFAGVWAHHANRRRPFIQAGDVEAALTAANAIGDDALQRSAGRAVVPDSFTHGSSAQRQRWFSTGFETGSVKACDTFAAPSL
jgi:predicted metalloprotease